MRTIFYGLLALLCSTAIHAQQHPITSTQNKNVRPVWSKQKAIDWYKQEPWIRGCNFIPSTAINQLEMWQADTFDSATINKELGWAANIGMNTMRVFLHHAAWLDDAPGFKKRINTYLSIANKHGIKTIFVFMDDCWNFYYTAGNQPKPKPGIHNSGWVEDPGFYIYADSVVNYLDDRALNVLEKYVKDILTTFKNDKRVLLWDLYNEPGNGHLGNLSMTLLQKLFLWGREINPSQPLTADVWNVDLKELSDYQTKNSDVFTYHCYLNETAHQHWIDSFRAIVKGPMICTEYMARKHNSRFANIMPLLKKENIGAINWGLVEGKTNTKYAWDEPMPNGAEPTLWFHEIFRKDGTPYKQDEVDIIKSLTKAK